MASKTTDLASALKRLSLYDSQEPERESSVPEQEPAKKKSEVGWEYDEERDIYKIRETFAIPSSLYKRLYDHQKIGVSWLCDLYDRNEGGILGDDMGLGKTFQTLTFLAGLMKKKKIRNALVVCPVSVLRSWESEAKDILKSVRKAANVIVITSQMTKNRKCQLLQEGISCSSQYPYLVVISYGLVQSNPYDVIPENYYGESCHWDYVILDEGHKIKNRKTKVHQGCRVICKRGQTNRLLLSGTPIQNKLEEFWNLFDWATDGSLLGSLDSFKEEFSFPIEQGRHKDATSTDLKLAHKANSQLQRLIKRNFLQRTKKETFFDKDGKSNASLPSKQDFVVWTRLSEKQRSLYEQFLDEDERVRDVITGQSKSPLIAVTALKKLCGHPTLFLPAGQNSYYDDPYDEIDDSLTTDSAKLQALKSMVHHLLAQDHRMLIFSQSVKMLNIIQRVLNPLACLRIDGTTKERDRHYIVNSFNGRTADVDIVLLSTKAAGIGLTLTGADVAIIYDPSWNPADDSQAVDRCYRIGQKKDVKIFRLISAGTVEERMYEKQVFKDGIRRAVLTNSGSATERHFDRQDLRRLFTLAPDGICTTMEKVKSKYEELEDDGGILSLLQESQHILGVSPHDALYQNIAENVDDCTNAPLFGGVIGDLTKVSKSYSRNVNEKEVSEQSYSKLGKAGKVMNTSSSNTDSKFLLIGNGGMNKTRKARHDVKSDIIDLSSHSLDKSILHNERDTLEKENVIPITASVQETIDLCDSSESESYPESDEDDNCSESASSSENDENLSYGESNGYSEIDDDHHTIHGEDEEHEKIYGNIDEIVTIVGGNENARVQKEASLANGVSKSNYESDSTSEAEFTGGLESSLADDDTDDDTDDEDSIGQQEQEDCSTIKSNTSRGSDKNEVLINNTTGISRLSLNENFGNFAENKVEQKKSSQDNADGFTCLSDEYISDKGNEVITSKNHTEHQISHFLSTRKYTADEDSSYLKVEKHTHSLLGNANEASEHNCKETLPNTIDISNRTQEQDKENPTTENYSHNTDLVSDSDSLSQTFVLASDDSSSSENETDDERTVTFNVKTNNDSNKNTLLITNAAMGNVEGKCQDDLETNITVMAKATRTSSE